MTREGMFRMVNLARTATKHNFIQISVIVIVVVVVSLPLTRDGGTASTAIQVHAVNLIELGQGNGGSHFEPVMND